MKPRITLGIPIIGDPCGEAFHHHLRLMGILSRHGKVSVPEVRETLPHDVARMKVVHAAKQNNSDLVFFVDDDTVVQWWAFERLYRAMRKYKAQVVSGHYSRRGPPYTCVWSKIVQGEFHTCDALAGVHEIDFSGLGCALVDIKWVLDKLTPPYFTMGKGEEGTIVLDDTSFYEKVRQAGGKILGHAGVRCIHMGGRTPICDETVVYLRQEHARVQAEVLRQKGLSNGSGNNRSQPSGTDSQPSAGPPVQCVGREG